MYRTIYFVTKGLFSLTMAFAALMTVLEISVPLAIQSIFDTIETSGSLNNLWYGIAIIGGLYIGSEVFNCLRIRVNNTFRAKSTF